MPKQTNDQSIAELEAGIENAMKELSTAPAGAYINGEWVPNAAELSKQTPTPMGPKKRDRAAARVARAEKIAASRSEGEHTGGSVNYYKLTVEFPTHAKKPYTVECNDVIEALGMDFAEGNVFKALWRTAAARQGKFKRNHDAVYDAEKIVFFGQRLLERARRYLTK